MHVSCKEEIDIAEKVFIDMNKRFKNRDKKLITSASVLLSNIKSIDKQTK